MENKYEDNLTAIVTGINTYSNLLNRLYKHEIFIEYSKIFNFILEQKDLTSCDYYALYDCTIYILELPANNERLALANKFIQKLCYAGEKGNLGAMVCLLILKRSFTLLDFDTKYFDTMRLDCLKFIAKAPPLKQKNKPQLQLTNEKISWAYLYMSLFQFIIKQEQNAFNRYFTTATNWNGVGAHFFGEMFLTTDKEFTNARKIIKPFEKKYTLLFCLNIFLSKVFLIQSEKKLLTEDEMREKLHVASRLIAVFKSYNPAMGQYIDAHIYLSPLYNHRISALECLKKAAKLGHEKAIEEIKALEKSEPVEQKPPPLPTKIKCNERNYLYKRNNSHYILFSARMARENITEINLLDKTYIDEKLFNEILAEITRNKKIDTIIFSGVDYSLDFVKLFDAIKNQDNIRSLEFYNCRFATKDWIRISLFVQTTNYIKSLCFTKLEVEYNKPKEYTDRSVIARDFEKERILVDKTIINLIANSKNIEKLELEGLAFFESDQEKITSFLTALNKNVGLLTCRITLRYIVFNNKNLLLLSEILNKFLYLNILFGEEHETGTKFDSNGLAQFTSKLKGNTRLKHLGLIRPLLDEETDNKLIKAMMDLIQVLVKDTKIVSLTLREVFLFGEKKSKFAEFCNLVGENAYIRSLDLSDNFLTDKDVLKIAYIFKRKSKIERLYLTGNPISHLAIVKLFEILIHHENNLLELGLNDIDQINCESEFDAKEYTTAISQFITHKNCKLEVLHLSANYILDLTEALKKNHSIRGLWFYGRINHQQLKALIAIAQENPRINLISYDNTDISYMLEPKMSDEETKNDIQKLESQLEANRAIKSFDFDKKFSFMFKEPDEEKPSKETIPPQRQKASLQTFINVFKSAEIQFELVENKDATSLIFEFSTDTLAQVIAATINSNRINAELSDKSITIPNYANIDEHEISSLPLVLKSKLQKEPPNQPNNKITLLSLLADVKKIALLEDAKNLNIFLFDNDRLTNDYRIILLKKIKTIFTTRGIEFYSDNYQICVYDYNELPECKIFGIATEIKKAVTEIYNAAKNKTVQEVTDQETRIEKVKEKRLKPIPQGIQTKSENEPIIIQQQIEAVGKEEETVLDEKIEYIAHDAYSFKNPTTAKFEELIGLLKQNLALALPSPLDKNITSIIRYHEELLSLDEQSDDETLLAYSTLYYSLRISELMNNYLHIHFSNDSSLIQSSYGISTILADVPDYFLPDKPTHTLHCLNKHPQSFLTVNRQILLELFDEKINVKNKLAGGFRNVYFYENFYENNINPKTTVIAPKNELTGNPINVLTKIRTIAEFVRNKITKKVSLHDLIFNSSKYPLELSAAKGAIFLLGHFIRLLRDNKNFCIKTLNALLAEDKYSRTLEKYLDEIMDPVTTSIQGYKLAAKLAELNESQISEIVKRSSFMDHCLLLIEARNLIRHNIPEENEVKDHDKIPLASVAIISVNFVASNKFNSKIKKLIISEKKLNTENTSQSLSILPQNYSFFDNSILQESSLHTEQVQQQGPSR